MVLRLWFESARAMFFLSILLNALPVPMLRQVFLDLQNRAPMQVKLTFSIIYRFFRFFVFSQNNVLPAWELHFRVFYCFLLVFTFFCVFEDTSKIAVLPAWELNFRKLDQQFYVFLRFLEMLKKHVFTCLSFSCFFFIFGVFL